VSQWEKPTGIGYHAAVLPCCRDVAQLEHPAMNCANFISSKWHLGRDILLESFRADLTLRTSMLRQATLERYFNTVWCIAASPYVTEYMVGYTRRPIKSRLAEYQQMHGYQYMTILANGLSLEDAHLLEGFLQKSIWESKKSGIMYRKYEESRKQIGRHFPNAGPTSNLTLEKTHTVYIAWWDQYTS
jgi:hypothetical protein